MVEKKSAAAAKPAAKVAAKAPRAVKAPAAEPVATPAALAAKAPQAAAPRSPRRMATVSAARIDAGERQRLIAEAAYYRAEKRGFAPGDTVSDWLDAEREIAAKYPH